MDTGAQDAALGAIREAMAQYLIDHEDRYPRADQLVVHVDYHDLHGWLDALDAAEARQTALVETLQDTTLVEALVEVVFCEFGDRAGLDLGVLVDCIQEDIRECLTTAFRAELVKAQGRALAASSAAEARQAALLAALRQYADPANWDRLIRPWDGAMLWRWGGAGEAGWTVAGDALAASPAPDGVAGVGGRMKLTELADLNMSALQWCVLEQEALLEQAAARQTALVALAHELVELEHGARGQQMQALHRLGIVVTLDEHLARARAGADKQHARIDALAASTASGGLAGEAGQR